MTPAIRYTEPRGLHGWARVCVMSASLKHEMGPPTCTPYVRRCSVAATASDHQVGSLATTWFALISCLGPITRNGERKAQIRDVPDGKRPEDESQLGRRDTHHAAWGSASGSP